MELVGEHGRLEVNPLLCDQALLPWSVQLTDKFVGGTRVVAYSDRDYGLYLARDTGP